MGSVRKRLEILERREPGKEGPPRSPEEVYDRIRHEAREDIAERLAAGENPLYRIAENGDVLNAYDGSTVNHYGDFVRVLDDYIRRLDQEIAELEDEEDLQDERYA